MIPRMGSILMFISIHFKKLASFDFFLFFEKVQPDLGAYLYGFAPIRPDEFVRICHRKLQKVRGNIFSIARYHDKR